QRLADTQAGAVDHDIDAAKLQHRLAQRLGNGVGVEHVDGRGECHVFAELLAQAGLGFVEAVAVGGDHASTVL
nr:hypothetical protein [Tanacetum cinerariifolium]